MATPVANDAVDAAAFAPPRFPPHPRPWQRIAVPSLAVNNTALGPRKIWKRIGAIPLSSSDRRYAAAVRELRNDGSGPRKRPRADGHVPAWGVAVWKCCDAAITNVKAELQRAKDAIDSFSATDLKDTSLPSTQHSATFPEATLRFVPRKRDNNRTPLVQPTTPKAPAAPTTIRQEYATSPVRAVAYMQLDADSADPGADAEHITRRAKRRLSRRISIMPPRESLDVESSRIIELFSPPKPTSGAAQDTAYASASSPLKRRASITAASLGAAPSPAGVVAGAGEEAHTISTTPSKPLPAEATDRVDPLHSPLTSVIIFDQPVAEAEETEEGMSESPNAARKRMSLHNMRRRETWNFPNPALGRRFSALFEGQEEAPVRSSSRRHSLLLSADRNGAESLRTDKTKKSNRRHTFHPEIVVNFQFIQSPTSDTPAVPLENDEPAEDIPNATNIAAVDMASATAVHGTSIVCRSSNESTIPLDEETVVVDVRANLDIFGSGPPVQKPHGPVTLPAVFTKERAKATLETTEGSEKNDDESDKVPNNGEYLLVDEQASAVFPHDPPEREIVFNDSPTETFEASTEDSVEDAIGARLSGDNSPTRNDEFSIVSSKPVPIDLSESLFLPLPETESPITKERAADEVNKVWQSPTSLELGTIDRTESSAISVELSALPYLSPDPEMSERRRSSIDVTSILPSPLRMKTDADDNGISAISPTHNTVEITPEATRKSPVCSPLPTRLKEEDDTLFAPMAEIRSEDDDKDDDVTVTMTLDLNSLADEQHLSAHEDSETEMLRKFVTRVRADKSAKAAAAAAAAASGGSSSVRSKIHLRQKRRSGSMGSTASASGSPVSKKEGVLSSASMASSPFSSLEKNRVPLGTKDRNMSPSPKKSRSKGSVGDEDGDDELTSRRRHKDLLSKPSLEDTSPARPKRRRKKMEADTGGIFNPEFMLPSSSSRQDEPSTEGPGPRRSKRTRTQTPSNSSKASTTNANSSTMSAIPIRLPGSLNLSGDDSYSMSTNGNGGGGGLNVSLNMRRNGLGEKDLAAVTRVNTRKNKGNADPPSVVVARQSREPSRIVSLGTKLSSVFDSPGAATSPGDVSKNDEKTRKRRAAPSKATKAVRWAEVLVRVQGSDSDKPAKSERASSSSPEVVRTDKALLDKPSIGSQDLADAEDVQDATTSRSSAPMDAVEPETQAAESGKPEKKFIPRRTTRVSRLPPPTPRKAIEAAAAAATAKSSSSNAAVVLSDVAGLKAAPSCSATAAPRMATRRTKILSMGISGNGTPAPKRRKMRG